MSYMLVKGHLSEILFKPSSYTKVQNFKSNVKLRKTFHIQTFRPIEISFLQFAKFYRVYVLKIRIESYSKVCKLDSNSEICSMNDMIFFLSDINISRNILKKIKYVKLNRDNFYWFICIGNNNIKKFKIALEAQHMWWFRNITKF